LTLPAPPCYRQRVGSDQRKPPSVTAFTVATRGSVSGDRIIVVDIPVYRDGKAIYALSFNPPLSMFQRMIEQKRFGSEWTVSIFDRTGTNFARVPNPEKTIGQKASPTLLAELFKQQEAKVSTVSLEGVPLLTAYSRSPVTDWIVAAGIPVALVTAPLWRTLAVTALIGAAFLLIGLGFAIRMAQEVARGESLQRLMVNELNHRVKNTLATVQSIAGQSFRNASDSEAKEKFESRLVALGRELPAYVIAEAGFGYSRERGPSNGLPPGWISPFRLPALPPTP